MNFGFIALHPVTLPLGNEINQAILNAMMYLYTWSMCIIKPVMSELIETVRLCS